MTTIIRDKTSLVETAYLVNGRRVYVNCAKSITADENGWSWTIDTGWITYKVHGGTKGGGTRYDWFLEDITNGDLYPVKSAVAALSLLDHM